MASKGTSENSSFQSGLDQVDFLANVSHEIRNPLNAMIGLVHLARNTEDPVDREVYMDGLQHSSEYLLEIVNNLMDFSKLQSGRLHLDQRPVHLMELLSERLQGQKLVAEEKGLGFHLYVAPDIPKFIILDPLKVGQLLINLVSNAIKFTATGEVAVCVRLLEQTEDQVRLEFQVRDTGKGISQENLETIFKAFHQGDADTNFNFGGTGLGLTISRRLAEMMGSELELESKLGEGAKFKFELLAGVQLQGSISSEFDDTTAGLAGTRILVVDDNALNRLVTSRILKGWEVSCATAATGTEALELVAMEQFDLILMDLQMPGMDGFEAANQIRGLGEYNGAPIIAVSGSLGIRSGGFTDSGFAGFLLKPFRPKDLLEKIQELLPITASR